MFENTPFAYKVHYHVEHRTVAFRNLRHAIDNSLHRTDINSTLRGIYDNPWFYRNQNQHGGASAFYSVRAVRRDAANGWEGWVYSLEVWYRREEEEEVLVAEIIPIADEPRVIEKVRKKREPKQPKPPKAEPKFYLSLR